MRWARRAAAAAAVVTIVVTAAILLWPLHANGLSGSALLPHYSRYFGFTAFGPLPSDPSVAQLRRAGVRFPQDVVEHRRHIAYLALGCGAVLFAACAATAVRATRRARRSPIVAA